MSDTLADLSSCLPSNFLSDDKPLFLNPPLYDFTSSESESDDDDVIHGFTHPFTRSFSLQDRLPYPLHKKGVFSGSPESTLNWNACGPTHIRSSPTTPFARPNDDSLDLIYAAAGQVARMKLNAVNSSIYPTRTLLGAPRPLNTIPPLTQHNCTMLNEKQMFIRQQHLHNRVSSSVNPNYPTTGRFVNSSVGNSAWPVYPVETTQRRTQPGSEFGFKPVPGGTNGGCGRTVKKGCAGTGVFLPRNYNNTPQEPKKNPVCSGANPPVRMAQSFTKNMDHNTSQSQANIQGVFNRQNQASPLPNQQHLKWDEVAEMIMAHKQRSVMLAQQRRSSISSHEGQAEVVLPQEWTY